jgi:hypothetical protein
MLHLERNVGCSEPVPVLRLAREAVRIQIACAAIETLGRPNDASSTLLQ